MPSFPPSVDGALHVSEPPSKLPQDFLDLILTAAVEYPDDEWEHISEDAKGLINAMLAVEPSERLTIEGALSHPFMLIVD